MAKDRLNDPGYKTPYTDEERKPSGNGRGRWIDHGGRSISSGPEAGSKGVTRSDGPRGRSTGTKRDLD